MIPRKPKSDLEYFQGLRKEVSRIYENSDFETKLTFDDSSTTRQQINSQIKKIHEKPLRETGDKNSILKILDEAIEPLQEAKKAADLAQQAAEEKRKNQAMLRKKKTGFQVSLRAFYRIYESEKPNLIDAEANAAEIKEIEAKITLWEQDLKQQIAEVRRLRTELRDSNCNVFLSRQASSLKEFDTVASAYSNEAAVLRKEVAYSLQDLEKINRVEEQIKTLEASQDSLRDKVNSIEKEDNTAAVKMLAITGICENYMNDKKKIQPQPNTMRIKTPVVKILQKLADLRSRYNKADFEFELTERAALLGQQEKQDQDQDKKAAGPDDEKVAKVKNAILTSTFRVNGGGHEVKGASSRLPNGAFKILTIINLFESNKPYEGKILTAQDVLNEIHKELFDKRKITEPDSNGCGGTFFKIVRGTRTSETVRAYDLIWENSGFSKDDRPENKKTRKQSF